MLKRTSANDIMQKSGTKGKPFASISLAELIDEIDSDDGMGASGQKDFEDHHGQSK